MKIDELKEVTQEETMSGFQDCTGNGYFLGQYTGSPYTNLGNEPTRALDPLDAAYLTQLNIEIVYAQKAYAMALNHIRKRYSTPESEWVLNNIEVGFQRITEKA